MYRIHDAAPVDEATADHHCAQLGREPLDCAPRDAHDCGCLGGADSVILQVSLIGVWSLACARHRSDCGVEVFVVPVLRLKDYPYGPATPEGVESFQRMILELEGQFPALKAEIGHAKVALWGASTQDVSDG